MPVRDCLCEWPHRRQIILFHKNFTQLHLLLWLCVCHGINVLTLFATTNELNPQKCVAF